MSLNSDFRLSISRSENNSVGRSFHTRLSEADEKAHQTAHLLIQVDRKNETTSFPALQERQAVPLTRREKFAYFACVAITVAFIWAAHDNIWHGS